MNPELLSQLKDIHVPQKPLWWPLASGYYIILALGLLVLFVFVYILIKYIKKIRIKKYINSEFARIKSRYLQDNNTSMLQNNISELVRRISLQSGATKAHDLGVCAEYLWGKNTETQEFIALLERDRFRKTTDISATRLLSLAQKKFKQCPL